MNEEDLTYRRNFASCGGGVCGGGGGGSIKLVMVGVEDGVKCSSCAGRGRGGLRREVGQTAV